MSDELKCLAAGILIGLILGIVIGLYTMQKRYETMAVDRGFAQCAPKTGEWEWLEKKAEKTEKP